MKKSRERDGMYDEMIKRLRKAMHLIGLIKVYEKLVLTAREAGKYLKRNAATW